MWHYSQIRLFIYFMIILVVVVVALWEVGLSPSDLREYMLAWVESLMQGEAAPAVGWLPSFLPRVFTNLLTFLMLLFLVFLVVYFFMQFWALVLERRLLLANEKKAGIITASVLYLAGRSRSFIHHLPQALQRREHYTLGRDTLLAPLQLALWAYPMVGFLGTVVGISQSVATLPKVLEDNQQLNNLLSSLYVAFDTTFAGLVGSLLVMLLVHVLQTRWEYNAVLVEHMYARES